MLVKITAKGAPDKGVWTAEPVWMRELNGSLVYKGMTNMKGEVTFLLPKGKKYMIDFKYLKGADVVNLTRNQGIGHNNRSVLYKPNPRYQFPELYIPKPDYFNTEYFSALHFTYEQPSEENVAVTSNFAFPIQSNFKEAILNIGLAADKKVQESDYANVPAVNLCFVVDVSGSMASDDRIGIVRENLTELVKLLRSEDIISIVTFSDHANVIIPATKIGAQKDKILFLISRLQEEGSTNIYEGLEIGFKELAKNYKQGRTNRVILLTDGYENTKTDAEVADVARKNYVKGLECASIGVGPDFNEPLVRAVATAGGGTAHIANEATALKSVFTKKLMSTFIYPIAKDVFIEVQFPKGLEYHKVWGANIHEKREGTIVIKSSNLFAGAEMLSIIKFKLDKPNKSLTTQPIKIKVKYYDLRKKQNITLQKEVFLKWQDGAGSPALFQSEAEKHLFLELSLKQTLQDMSEAFYKKDISKAKTILQEGLKELSPYSYSKDFPAIKELLKQANEYKEILENLK